jgi:trk system potassium uptake protein TrkH
MRWYLMTMVFFALLLTFWNWAVRDMGAYEALRSSFFNVVAVLTTTGFHTNDYDSWGGFAEIAFFMMAFVGGCTGSAAGGIKIFRYEVLFAMVRVHARRLLHPHGIFIIRFNDMPVSNLVLRSVLTFVMFYFFAFAGVSVLLSMTGLDDVTSLSASAAALGNLGPGLGKVIGPGHDYGAIPQAAKWILAGGMMLGRLEVATVLILAFPGFWKE